MLSTMRSSWLLFAVLVLAALAQALSIEEMIHLDGIEAYLHHGEKRQASGTGSSTPETTPSRPSTPSNTPSPPTTSRSTTQNTTPSAPPPTSTPDPTPSEPTTSRSSEPTTSDKPTATSDTRTPTPTTTTRPLLGTSTRSYVTIITTVSDGQTLEQTSTGQSTETFTSGSVVETTSALPQAGNSSGGGGLSDNSKKIIGGVVGGVGGAILLGGIALVCWRMWGKKNRVAEDDADLMANTGAALGDKPQNASPFQSNLEQYHNPGGRPNAAANF